MVLTEEKERFFQDSWYRRNNPPKRNYAPCMSDRDEWKCRTFEGALYKCIARGNGEEIPMDGIEKHLVADLVREHPVDELFSIFDMGKKAMAGYKQARIDLINWYHGAKLSDGVMAAGDKRYAKKMLSEYRTY